MQIEPLSKKIYDKAIALGISQIELLFSGGNDEGYLNVSFRGEPFANEDFEQEVIDWGYTAYSYSGAGDGNDYGDDIVYDLLKKTATVSSWSMQRTEDLPKIGSLEIAE